MQTKNKNWPPLFYAITNSLKKASGALKNTVLNILSTKQKRMAKEYLDLPSNVHNATTINSIHLHKKDYYSLYAFFNNSKEPGYEGDVGTSQPAKTPFMKLTREEIENVMSFINKRTPRL